MTRLLALCFYAMLLMPGFLQGECHDLSLFFSNLVSLWCQCNIRLDVPSMLVMYAKDKLIGGQEI